MYIIQFQTQIAREQVPLLKSDCATKLAYSNYHDIATALGGQGMLMNNETKLEQVFSNAQREYEDKNNSVLINAIIGRTDFRDGSISV